MNIERIVSETARLDEQSRQLLVEAATRRATAERELAVFARSVNSLVKDLKRQGYTSYFRNYIGRVDYSVSDTLKERPRFSGWPLINVHFKGAAYDVESPISEVNRLSFETFGPPEQASLLADVEVHIPRLLSRHAEKNREIQDQRSASGEQYRLPIYGGIAFVAILIILSQCS